MSTITDKGCYKEDFIRPTSKAATTIEKITTPSRICAPQQITSTVQRVTTIEKITTPSTGRLRICAPQQITSTAQRVCRSMSLIKRLTLISFKKMTNLL